MCAPCPDAAPDRLFERIASLTEAANVVYTGDSLGDASAREAVMLDLLAVAALLARLGRDATLTD